ncbi:MAG: hypothetical protein LKH51_07140, partial [Eubacterium sp.]|nr:hypothetical protein [Eubacterium sp.]
YNKQKNDQQPDGHWSKILYFFTVFLTGSSSLQRRGRVGFLLPIRQMTSFPGSQPTLQRRGTAAFLLSQIPASVCGFTAQLAALLPSA